MNRLYKNILILVIIILAFVQIICINIMNKVKNIKVSNMQNITYNHKTLKEFNDELNCLKEKRILSANEVNGKWYVKVKVEGKREELLNEISKLGTYNISDFIINKNQDENSVILEISSKESV